MDGSFQYGANYKCGVPSPAPIHKKLGSEQELVTDSSLGCFPDGDEFGPGSCHALSLQEQVAKVLVPSTASQQRLDIAVDRFYDAHRDPRSAVVQNAVQMIEHHPG